MSNIVIVSGGFDPVHKGHIELFNDAASWGGLWLCLNSDAWLTKKKGKPFIEYEERKYILENLKAVKNVISMNDEDGTACDGILTIYKAVQDTLKANALYRLRGINIFFANGGDRKTENTPEISLCNKLGIKLLWGIGGEKIQSSSALLSGWKSK